MIRKALEQHPFRIVWDHLRWFPPQVVPVLFPSGERFLPFCGPSIAAFPFLAESRPKSKNSLQRSERKCWPEMTCIYNLAGLGRVFLTLPDKFFGTSNVAKIVHLAPHFRVSEAATIPDCGQAENWPPVKTPESYFQMSMALLFSRSESVESQN